MFITTLSFCVASLQLAYSTVTIKPDTVNNDITVSLAPDTRTSSLTEFENNGVYNNEWRINYKYDGQSMADWPLSMTLSGDKYGFQSGQVSSLKITMEATCLSSQCDAFWAFGVNNNQQYATFINDFDGGWKKKASQPSSKGIYIYPTDGADKNLVSGDASTIISSATTGLRTRISGGNSNNWHKVTGSTNGNTFPVTFEFINDAIADTFTIRFISSTFSSGLTSIYGSAVQSLSDFTLYLTPDEDNELGLLISQFIVESINTGNPMTSSPSEAPTTANPTVSPTTDPTRSPTNDPTTSPTPDPTTDPTKSPTTDPTISPTPDPTDDPTTTSPTGAPSPDPFDRYEIGPNPVNFTMGIQYCNSIQKTLAVPRNIEDNVNVHGLCRDRDSSGMYGCWIGLYKDAANIWQWADNVNQYMLQYLNNEDEYPVITDFNDNCAAIPKNDYANFRKWESYPCDELKYPVCDHPTFAPTLSSTAEPTRPTLEPSVSPSKSPSVSPTTPTSAPTSCTVESQCPNGSNCKSSEGWVYSGPQCSEDCWSCGALGLSECCNEIYSCQRITCTEGNGRRLLEAELNNNNDRV